MLKSKILKKITGEDVSKIDKILEELTNEITHELRTPLVTIKAGISAIKDNISLLISTYEMVKSQGKASINIPPKQLELLTKTLDNSDKEVHYANFYIDLLAFNFKTKHLTNLKAEKFLIKTCIESAVSSFSNYFSRYSAIIDIKTSFEDFYVIANINTLEKVFINLLMNIANNIEFFGKGHIEIKNTREYKYNRLIIKDTSIRLTDEQQKLIFKKSNPYLRKSISYGMSFSKKILENLGGNISCFSKYNDYTEYLLDFPIVQQ